jgi:integrase
LPRYKRGRGSLFKRGKTWWMTFYVGGVRVRESARTTDKDVAKDLLDTRIGQRAEGKLVIGADRITFDELADDVLTDYRVNERKSERNAELRLRLHLRPFFGKMRAHAICPADVGRYVDKRRGESAPNATINRELALLKRAYTLGIDGGKITRRPKVRMLEENNVRRGFFERSDLETLLPHLPEWLRPAISFAFATGWRLPSEILTLTWDRVDLEVGTIRLDPGTTKSKEGRVIYATEEMAGILRRQHETRPEGCEYVFHLNGRQIRSYWNAWRRGCEAAGIVNRVPHDLRRSAVRTSVRAGVPETIAMKLSGHKTRAIFDRYAIVSDRDLRDAAERLNQAFRPRLDTSSDTTAETAPAEERVTH